MLNTFLCKINIGNVKNGKKGSNNVEEIYKNVFYCVIFRLLKLHCMNLNVCACVHVCVV